MSKLSAGILLYRQVPRLEVLLVHPGGPYWAKKDDLSWSIPKGLYSEGENPEAAARREFEEETGRTVGETLFELGTFKQPSGKSIRAWAAKGDFDLSKFRSNDFALEWPPRSGRMESFPEADRASWFSPAEAVQKIIKGQRSILISLLDQLGVAHPSEQDGTARSQNSGQGSLF